MYDLDQLRRSPASRRSFLAAMTAAGVGLAASNLLAGDGLTPTPAPGSGPTATGVPTDGNAQFSGIPGRNINEKVLNFALTLEILEADLYRQALNIASGRSLATALNSNSGVYTRKVGSGGLSADDTDKGFVFLKQFTYIEAAHRDFLITVLRSLGAPMVSANPRGYKFPSAPAGNIASILGKILPLEETGVRAYLGALPYLTDLGIATTAGGIYSTEARHSAVISSTLGIDPGPRPMPGDQKVTPTYPGQNTFEYFLKPQTVLTVARQFFA